MSDSNIPINDSSTEVIMYSGPELDQWKNLQPVIPPGTDKDDEEKINTLAKQARDEIKNLLLTSLQMQHVVVLAGSGTSLGPVTKGPSMWELWDYCVNENPGTGNTKREISATALSVISEVGYDVTIDKENIEALLSRCEAYLQVKSNSTVNDFITASKQTILSKCSEFLDLDDAKQLNAHRTFLHRLSRRRVRDSRLKLFSTNYDLCFETAASLQGLVVLDGFSFTQPRQFDPRFFNYDIVRRPTTGDEIGIPLEGVFHIYKLHGSVNWLRKTEGEIVIDNAPSPESACLIYPAKGKYQQSYVQPHLELISQYFSVIREPNTCLIVAGFGFNDDHLSEPILAAVRTNPHLRLIIVNPIAKDLATQTKEDNNYWDKLYQLSQQGEDVWFINARFGDFAEMIPDLKSLTPAQRLTREIKQISDS